MKNRQIASQTPAFDQTNHTSRLTTDHQMKSPGSFDKGNHKNHNVADLNSTLGSYPITLIPQYPHDVPRQSIHLPQPPSTLFFASTSYLLSLDSLMDSWGSWGY